MMAIGNIFMYHVLDMGHSILWGGGPKIRKKNWWQGLARKKFWLTDIPWKKILIDRCPLKKNIDWLCYWTMLLNKKWMFSKIPPKIIENVLCKVAKYHARKVVWCIFAYFICFCLLGGQFTMHRYHLRCYYSRIPMANMYQDPRW